MNASHCTYSGDREEALIAYVYDDGDGVALAAFESHLAVCVVCTDELAALRGVRTQLSRWSPPEPHFAVGDRHSRAQQRASWWREVPVWAQVAAALLFLGVSAGIANLDVRYDTNGLSVRTGWMKAPPAATAAPSSAAQAAPAPWRSDLTALERQLRDEFRAVQTSAPSQVHTARPAAAPDADVVQRVRALLQESERRQKSELALRLTEVMRDVQAQRQADLVKIDRTLGAVQNNLGVEVMKDRQKLNTLLIRTSGGSRD